MSRMLEFTQMEVNTVCDVFEYTLNCTSCINNNFITLKVELCKFVGQHHCVTLLGLLKRQLHLFSWAPMRSKGSQIHTIFPINTGDIFKQ